MKGWAAEWKEQEEEKAKGSGTVGGVKEKQTDVD